MSTYKHKLQKQKKMSRYAGLRSIRSLIFLVLLIVAIPSLAKSQTVTLDFGSLAVGTVITDQFKASGVLFSGPAVVKRIPDCEAPDPCSYIGGQAGRMFIYFIGDDGKLRYDILGPVYIGTVYGASTSVEKTYWAFGGPAGPPGRTTFGPTPGSYTQRISFVDPDGSPAPIYPMIEYKVVAGSTTYGFTSVSYTKPTPSLFTAQSDVVDFNTLSSTQILAIKQGGLQYDALAGSDNVVLPSTTSVAGATWDAKRTFAGGPGDDIIRGQGLSDIIDGGADDDTIELGKGDNDIGNGGEGDDTFRVHKGDGADSIDGGTGDDTVYFDGAATDYVMISPPSSRVTQLREAATGKVVSLTSVEKIVFAEFGNNRIVASNIFLEIARMSLKAYDDVAENFSAITPVGWRPVTAEEFGMPKIGSDGDIQFTFNSGVYIAAGSGILEGTAVAHVYTGLWNGQPTVGIFFRGTDDKSDRLDWISGTLSSKGTFFSDHYKRFVPLLLKLQDYNVDAGVRQILVGGHSLGGAMAQLFMQSSQNADKRYIGATFGAPGAASKRLDPRIIHFVHSQDPVGIIVPDLLSATVGFAGERVVMPIEPRLGTTPPGQLYGGNLLRLNETIEHAMEGYLIRLTDLVALSPKQLPTTVTNLSHMPGKILTIIAGSNGANTLAGDPENSTFVGWANDKIFGRNGNDKIYGRLGDDELVGGFGDDLIDGGPGTDTAVFDGKRMAYNVSCRSTYWQVAGVGNRQEGSDRVTSTEYLRFDDGRYRCVGSNLVKVP